MRTDMIIYSHLSIFFMDTIIPVMCISFHPISNHNDLTGKHIILQYCIQGWLYKWCTTMHACYHPLNNPWWSDTFLSTIWSLSYQGHCIYYFCISATCLPPNYRYIFLLNCYKIIRLLMINLNPIYFCYTVSFWAISFFTIWFSWIFYSLQVLYPTQGYTGGSILDH